MKFLHELALIMNPTDKYCNFALELMAPFNIIEFNTDDNKLIKKYEERKK